MLLNLILTTFAASWHITRDVIGQCKFTGTHERYPTGFFKVEVTNGARNSVLIQIIRIRDSDKEQTGLMTLIRRLKKRNAKIVLCQNWLNVIEANMNLELPIVDMNRDSFSALVESGNRIVPRTDACAAYEFNFNLNRATAYVRQTARSTQVSCRNPQAQVTLYSDELYCLSGANEFAARYACAQMKFFDIFDRP